MKEINAVLASIQKNLRAPKNQYNKFGQYNYRSCEDILEALKPLTTELGATITISDEMVEVGGRIYVKATATLRCGEESVSTTAYAREAEAKKGMDESQITGATSSYARKYALNGLFAIDDNKDADDTNTHGKAESAPTSSSKPRDNGVGNLSAPTAPAPQRVAQAVSAPSMTLEEAFAMDATYGDFAGYTLGTMYQSNPKTLNSILAQAKEANNTTLVQAIMVIARETKREG
jgi:hypothetical protein